MDSIFFKSLDPFQKDNNIEMIFLELIKNKNKKYLLEVGVLLSMRIKELDKINNKINNYLNK